ncbi:MAG: hypothetical protein N3D75_01135 [Candidatus Aenigmarchaeota archaeon]|nr:hypothetical protein [Candidatus Aenigmarchaeota archaeon]
MTIHLALLLHLYQPPWQRKDVLDRIVNNCYRDIIEYNGPGIDLNINYSLIELLRNNRYEDVLTGFALKNRGCEITNSAAYHPIIPLILQLNGGERVIQHQIDLNREGLREIGISTKGFFPPELAIDERTLEFLQRKAEWVLVDSICYDAVNQGTIPYNYIALYGRLPVFFRSRNWSNEFTLGMPGRRDFDLRNYANRLKSGVRNWFGDDGYIILAFDGETFGEQVGQYRSRLKEFVGRISEQGIKIVRISDLLKFYSERKKVQISPGSWSTDMSDISRGFYYPLWLDNNDMHRRWYEGVKRIVDAINSNGKNPELHKLLNSCIPWWISMGNNDFYKEWMNQVGRFM